ncbi:MAG: DJ-1/PfpI family protein [Oceanicaulis sp.]|uniref:DJ-1/PfpI family protein n=1 Tax=Glycocaulis sp. TaxID=1969725 RepID=UPI0025BE1631|nr:DJ-1/PfpI family protein [Glycocaulis sp.]MCC5981521.1 DJ-1/PfpI family protein [Oceanicaulis sp.]MCH8522875.1 DJ-1/PfpI family protein [Glycocaulis sp.]
MTPSKRPYRHQREPRIDIARVGESGSILALAAASFSVPDLNAAASAAERAGYRLIVASDARALVSGRTETGEEMNFVVDSALDEASAEDVAGLVLPGGRRAVDTLNDSNAALRLIQDVFASGRPIFAAGEALTILSEVSGKETGEANAALALGGEVFAASGETARDDVAKAFAEALQPGKSKAA